MNTVLVVMKKLVKQKKDLIDKVNSYLNALANKNM